MQHCKSLHYNYMPKEEACTCTKVSLTFIGHIDRETNLPGMGSSYS
jgi:hypothetical protein